MLNVHHTFSSCGNQNLDLRLRDAAPFGRHYIYLFILQVLDPMRGVVLNRFGLMHLIATNVCEWLNVVIQETRDDIVAVAYDRPAVLRYTNMSGPSRVIMTKEVTNTSTFDYFDDFYINGNFTNSSEAIHANLTAKIEAWSCNVSDMITPLIRTMNPYLRPCGVEYSLLCSVIIVVIYNDICTVPGSVTILLYYRVVMNGRSKYVAKAIV